MILTCQIKDLTANIKTELISHLKSCTLALQTGRSVDVSGHAGWLVLIWYHCQLIIDLILCACLATYTGLQNINSVVPPFLNLMVFPATPVLTFVPKVREQWWVILLVPWHESS